MSVDKISLKDFINYVKSNVNFDDEASIRSVEPYLRKLNNNKDLLPEAICNELRQSVETFQSENTYQASGYILYKDEDFIVRAVCWLPLSKRKFLDPEIDRGLLVYSAPHDHDFSFMTIGHFGPGYYSDIYEYDYDRVLGLEGESVELKKLDFDRLSENKVFFFRAGKDVHIQIPPDEISVSLNFIVRKRGSQKFLDQYWFDVENNKINRALENDTFRRAKSIDLITALGGDDCFDDLYELKDTHTCRRTRISIMEALTKIKPDLRKQIWSNASNDPDPVIRHAASSNL
ncbi:hypothetical protein [Alteromonas portus]|uniref:hypothetical protein n=1 Tax=Alteromonas portus TaxID=2565549 RepID=UPI003BF91B44